MSSAMESLYQEVILDLSKNPHGKGLEENAAAQSHQLGLLERASTRAWKCLLLAVGLYRLAPLVQAVAGHAQFPRQLRDRLVPDLHLPHRFPLELGCELLMLQHRTPLCEDFSRFAVSEGWLNLTPLVFLFSL